LGELGKSKFQLCAAYYTFAVSHYSDMKDFMREVQHFIPVVRLPESRSSNASGTNIVTGFIMDTEKQCILDLERDRHMTESD
jgi:hypothetical protein